MRGYLEGSASHRLEKTLVLYSLSLRAMQEIEAKAPHHLASLGTVNKGVSLAVRMAEQSDSEQGLLYSTRAMC